MTDDDGHTLNRGQRTAVCDKTFHIYSSDPYRGDIEPVKEYFAGHGIATEIQKSGAYYILQSRQRYGSTKKQGSDGYLALKKIKEVKAH